MERISVKNLHCEAEKFSEKTISVCGWVRSIRASNAFGFIELTDGSCFSGLQIVIEEGKLDNYRELAKQNVGCAISATGVLTLTPEAKQPFELNALKVVVEGTSTHDYPLQKKRHSFEFLRTIAHLRPRSNTFGAVFRVRSAAAHAIHKFFCENGFLYVQTPIITASDCEGAGEMFRVTTLDLENLPRTEKGSVDFSHDFFGKKTNLTVSGQLNAECFALAYSKVYTFGPTFRAEKSSTARHAAEFWMIEPEIAFADLSDDMKLSEDMIKYVIEFVMEQCADDIDFFNKFIDTTVRERLCNLLKNDFVRITYTEAIKILQDSKVAFEFPVSWGMDLQTEHERYITENVFGKPVFVTDYPRDIKAFYMRLNNDERTVAAMDMLVPGVGELIGGSQREERPKILIDSMKRSGLNPKDYSWYLDLRKYGGVKHSGFGLGFERLIMYITGISNIRDVEAFPRTYGLAEF